MLGTINLADPVVLVLAELVLELDGEKEMSDSGVVAGVVVLKVRSFPL